MEEQTEQQEPTPQEQIAEQIKSVPLDKRNFGLSDVFTNVLRVGDIQINSPIMPIKEMVSTTKELLKDKQVRDYLEGLKSTRIKIGKEMFK